MKKILLIFALAILSFTSYSQMKGSYVVANRTQAFNQPLPAYTLVYQTDSMKYWYLTAGSAATGTLATVSKVRFTPLAQRTVGGFTYRILNDPLGSNQLAAFYITNGTHNFTNGAGIVGGDTVSGFSYQNATNLIASFAYRDRLLLKYVRSDATENNIKVFEDSMGLYMKDVRAMLLDTNSNFTFSNNTTVQDTLKLSVVSDSLWLYQLGSMLYIQKHTLTNPDVVYLRLDDGNIQMKTYSGYGFYSSESGSDKNVITGNTIVTGKFSATDTSKFNIIAPYSGTTTTFPQILSVKGNTNLGDAATDLVTITGDATVSDDFTVTDVTTLNGNMTFGNGTDSIFFNSDTIVDILTTPYLTGNIANSTTLLDTVFTTVLFGYNNINTGRNLTPNTAGTASYIQSGGATSGATDKNGGMMTIKPGLSTGTGMSSIRLQRLSRAVSTGTTDNALYDAVIVPSGFNLTDAGNNDLFEISLADAGEIGAGVTIQFTIIATDATDVQTYTGKVVIALANDAGTLYESIVEHDATSDMSTGTLTTVWSVVDGVNKVTIRLVPTSSLTPTSFKCYYTIFNNSLQTITQL